MIYFLYPETANLSLEQIDLLFTGGKVLRYLPVASYQLYDVDSAEGRNFGTLRLADELLRSRNGPKPTLQPAAQSLMRSHRWRTPARLSHEYKLWRATCQSGPTIRRGRGKL